MGKINKVYPSFYNGVSQQLPELMLDNQCKEMNNCVPNLVKGLHKRPPVTFVQDKDIVNPTEQVFHSYDRGEDDEEYIFIQTDNASNPIEVYNKAGVQMTVEYDVTDETEIKTYLSNGRLKALTVQDRTWVFNKDKNVGTDVTGISPSNTEYKKEAYYWLKRGSGDRYNPYNYAVYLDGVTYACNPNKPSTGTADPATGFEDSDYAATYLTNLINANSHNTRMYSNVSGSMMRIRKGTLASKDGTTNGSITAYDVGYSLIRMADDAIGTNITYYDMADGVQRYNAQVRLANGGKFSTGNGTSWKGLSDITPVQTGTYEFTYTFPSIDYYQVTTKNYYNSVTHDVQSYTNDHDFTFDSWDSWGNQASDGWKGSVNAITDLPKDFPWVNTYIEITGDNRDNFTNYYVKWNGTTWEETLDPEVARGRLIDMPIACDRTALVAGVATFTLSLIPWVLPRVGNTDNNPDPSFVGNPITDILFYKNRFGIASTDSVVLSQTANYENFYIKTAVDIIDTDPIDVAIASNQASKIYYTKPFNNSLYIFTKYSQYELRHEGFLSPETVSIDNVTNYPMATDVEPKVVNNSLFFISITNNKQQLREYIKNDKLAVEGVDLNIATPTYLEETISEILVNGVLGMVLCCTKSNIIYVYNYKDDGQKRVQNAWSTWKLLDGLSFTANSFEYGLLDATMLVICKTTTKYIYHNLQLDDVESNNKIDTSTASSTYPFKASVRLPDYYPHIGNIGTPKDKVLLKKVTIEGTGSFDASVYRKDYNRTYTKSHLLGLKDLDLHIASKVGNVEIDIYDNTINDFNISSIIMEGLFSPTSREMR